MSDEVVVPKHNICCGIQYWEGTWIEFFEVRCSGTTSPVCTIHIFGRCDGGYETCGAYVIHTKVMSLL